MRARNVVPGVILILIGIYFIAKAGHTNGSYGSYGGCDESCDRAMIRKEFVGYSSNGEKGSMIGGIVLIIVGGCLILFRKGKKSR